MSRGSLRSNNAAWLLLVLAPALLPALPPAAGCLPVSGVRIVAKDLAPLNPAWADAAVTEDLGPAPAPGYHRIITAAGIAAWASRNKLVPAAAAGACFEWRLEPVSRERIAAAISSAFPPGTVVEIVDHSRFLAPAGELTFPRSGLNLPPGASSVRPAMWRGQLTYAPGRSVPVWAKIKAVASISRVVAVEALPALKTIASNQVRFETVDAFPLAEAAVLELDDVIGKIPRRSLRSGQVLTKDLLREPPDVERGSSVAIQAQSGGAILRFSATALTGGHTGETILLRNPENGRRFKAEITSKGQAAAIEAAPEGRTR